MAKIASGEVKGLKHWLEEDGMEVHHALCTNLAILYTLNKSRC